MLESLIEKLKKVKDYRKAKGRRHPLWLVLLIVILGLMTKNLGYRELENFAKINQKELSQVLKIKLKNPPSYSTIRRVIEGVEWSDLIEIFNEWSAALVIESGNDYIIALKKNRKKLYEQVEALTRNEKPLSVALSHEGSHGRKVNRQVSIYQVNSNFHKDWKHLKRVVEIERSGWRGKKPYKEKVYYISSIVNEAEKFAEIIKGHWGIENQYHWVKDVIFNEDKSRIRNFQAAMNFSTLKTLVINFFRSCGFVSITEGQRWLTEQWHKIFILGELFPLKS